MNLIQTFIHKPTGLIIPQEEHAKLAADIAKNWGNNLFQGIPKFRNEFIQGVLTHDRGFGKYDTIEIGGKDRKYNEQERIELIQKGFKLHDKDSVVDITVLHHLKKLCSFDDFLHDVGEDLSKNINQQVQGNNLDDSYHKMLQTITWFCDNIAFDFSLGKNQSTDISVISSFDNKTEENITIRIEGNRIQLSPFPLGKSISGTIVGYEAENYPKKLVPHELKYTIEV